VWIRRRPAPNEARDAHSLYLETLAELGPPGLALLAATLVVPFVVGRGPALGAYAAFVVQAGVDWEWELPAVTLAGLLCGVAVLRAAPAERLALRRPARVVGVAAAAGVAALAVVGLEGNRALDGAAAALRRGDAAAAAADARSARRWAPWSAEPDRIEAAARSGDPALLRRAVAKEPNDWSLWAALADATTGAERRRAAATAARLNPLAAAAPSG
jgi:hypothetical protein